MNKYFLCFITSIIFCINCNASNDRTITALPAPIIFRADPQRSVTPPCCEACAHDQNIPDSPEIAQAKAQFLKHIEQDAKRRFDKFVRQHQADIEKSKDINNLSTVITKKKLAQLNGIDKTFPKAKGKLRFRKMTAQD